MMKAKVNDLSIEEFKEIIVSTIRKEIESFSEDFMALSSQNYLDSIQEARREYQEGKVVSLEDALNV